MQISSYHMTSYFNAIPTEIYQVILWSKQTDFKIYMERK